MKSKFWTVIVNETYADGMVAAMYGQQPPSENASKTAPDNGKPTTLSLRPRWDAEGKLIKRAHITVIHNGIDASSKGFLREHPYRAVGDYSRSHPPQGTIELYEHGNPVRFRTSGSATLAIMINPTPDGMICELVCA